MSTEIRNAIITSATISTADHGCLTIWIQLDFGGMGQGFGGYNLYIPKTIRRAKDKQTPDINYTGHFMWRVMEVADVLEWDKLVGKTIRVKREDGLITAIGHIVKDIWFCPKEEFTALHKDCTVR